MLLYFLIGLQLLLILVVSFYSFYITVKLLRNIDSKHTVKALNSKVKNML